MKQKLLILFLLLTYNISLYAQSEALKDYKTIYTQGFGKEKSLEDFNFSDKSKWIISKNGKSGKSLKCLGRGSYKNSFGGPSIIALLTKFEVKDFVIEVDVMQNGKDYNLLDFCIFFGIKDTAHYCYAQLASKADKKTHNIFIIDSDKPKRIGQKHNEGVIWGMKQWQHIKIEHFASDKTIKVYFNNELVLESSEELFMEGHIGIGSSNSAIKIDNLKVSAPAHKINNKKLFN